MSSKMEGELGVKSFCSAIKADNGIETSLRGLWAVGDACACVSGQVQQEPPPGGMPGSGLGFALYAALKAGPSAAYFAAQTDSPEVSYDEVKKLKGEIFAPMKRDKGILPNDFVSETLKVIKPVKYYLHRTKDNMEEVLSGIKKLQDRVPELMAKDYHGLCRCNEARSMPTCAEIPFRSALARTESRGFHMRDDYTEKDDKNWLKWVVVKQDAGKESVSTEPVPIERYKHTP